MYATYVDTYIIYLVYIYNTHTHLKICEGQASRAWNEICKHTCWQTSTRRRPESRRVSSDSHGKLPRYAKTQWPCYATHLAMAQQWWNITRQVNFHSLLSCSGGCRKVQVLGSCEKPSLVNAIIKNHGEVKAAHAEPAEHPAKHVAQDQVVQLPPASSSKN